jgi:hypothetical protein
VRCHDAEDSDEAMSVSNAGSSLEVHRGRTAVAYAGKRATMMASSSSDKHVDFGSFGPVGKSATESRCFHFCSGLRIDPIAPGQRPQALLIFVLLDGLPLSLWRSREEPVP